MSKSQRREPIKAAPGNENPGAVPSLSIKLKCLRIHVYLHHFATEENV
jgi:hypothetical protein